MKAKGWTVEAIAKARADSYINPNRTIGCPGFGNNYQRLFQDQRSRAGVYDYGGESDGRLSYNPETDQYEYVGTDYEAADALPLRTPRSVMISLRQRPALLSCVQQKR